MIGHRCEAYPEVSALLSTTESHSSPWETTEFVATGLAQLLQLHKECIRLCRAIFVGAGAAGSHPHRTPLLCCDTSFRPKVYHANRTFLRARLELGPCKIACCARSGSLARCASSCSCRAHSMCDRGSASAFPLQESHVTVTWQPLRGCTGEAYFEVNHRVNYRARRAKNG